MPHNSKYLPHHHLDLTVVSSWLGDAPKASVGSLLMDQFCDHSEAVEPDGLESKVDNTVTATEVDSEDLPTMVDTGKSHISEEVPSTVDSLQTPGMTEQQYPHFTEGKAHLDPNSAESGVPYSKEKPNIEEISGSGHFEEIGLSTSYVGSDGSNVASLERPSRYLTDPGDNDHAVLDEVSGTLVVEDQAIYSADATSVVGNGICLLSDVVCSPSRSPTNLLESLPGFMVPSQKEVELDEGACPEAAMEPETRKELCHGEVASTDSDLNTSTPVYYYHSTSKIDDNNDDLPLDERTQNSLSAAASSLDLRGQQSELIHSSNSYHLEDREYAVALPTSSVPEPETTSEKSPKLRANLVDGEWVVTDDAGRHPESPLEESESRVDQLDARSLQVDQPSINSSSLPSEEMESLNHMAEESGEHFESQKHIDQGIYVDAALESCQEDLPIQSSTSQFSSKSAGQDADNVNQTPNPLEPARPSIGMQPDGKKHMGLMRKVKLNYPRLKVGEKVQPGSSPFPPTLTTQGISTHTPDVSLAVTQPLNQQAPGADTMTHNRSSQYSEGEGNPFVTSIPPPPVAEEQLRKVTERVWPQIGPKADERDSLLEQIRTKSFNLKPAAATRPSIPGPTPKTNLKVAEILEKANTIRQALAGSDDEHDDDDIGATLETKLIRLQHPGDEHSRQQSLSNNLKGSTDQEPPPPRLHHLLQPSQACPDLSSPSRPRSRQLSPQLVLPLRHRFRRHFLPSSRLSTHKTPNIYVWNTMIRGLVSSHCFDDAIVIDFYFSMRRQGFLPNGFTFPLVLKACASWQPPPVDQLKLNVDASVLPHNCKKTKKQKEEEE
ncbi:hypothetical protein L484_025889 [Morus notabilis]|uniref:Protein SCAR n=1 Tax=Morus notabilis TaxID=981085 RepID=W9RR59_9ROSA|nr:hypothetical protein L484_025889 [Morus notabilis]